MFLLPKTHKRGLPAYSLCPRSASHYAHKGETGTGAVAVAGAGAAMKVGGGGGWGGGGQSCETCVPEII